MISPSHKVVVQKICLFSGLSNHLEDILSGLSNHLKDVSFLFSVIV